MEAEALFLGVLNIDMVLEASDQIIGNKIMGSKVSTHAGGYGTTQSIGCARSGVSSAVIGKIGNDAFGSDIISTLDSEGIDRCCVEILDGEKTGLSTIIVRSHAENMYLDFLGANFKMEACSVEQRLHDIQQCKFLGAHIGVATVEPSLALMKIADAFGIPIVVNFSTVDLPENLFFTQPDYIVLSYATASMLCGFAVNNLKGARIASTLLLPYAKKAVIFQMDCAGVMVSTPESCDVVDVDPTQTIVDPSGMSDFFLGVFVAQMIKGNDLLESVSRAHKAAMYCGSRVGVYESFPSREFLQWGT